jgi:hypothetical protein
LSGQSKLWEFDQLAAFLRGLDGDACRPDCNAFYIGLIDGWSAFTGETSL